MITGIISGRDIAVSRSELILRLPASESVKADKEYEVTLKEKTKKRSLDANAYLWVLLGEIALKLNTTSEAVYKEYIRDYGMYRDSAFLPDEVDTFRYMWEHHGLGWPTVKLDFTGDGERIMVRFYYGSSCYDTKQMSRLINAVVADCLEMGIETKTKEELDSLMSSWRAKL